MSTETQCRIAIVTDSTVDLPQASVEEFGLHIAPQILIMGENTWRDRVDIDSATFYDLLHSAPDFPSTSQPSVPSFRELFVELAQEYEGIAAILVSDELSGTINSAQMAAEELPNIPIEIVDSRAVSMQLGFIVLAAARVAQAGGDLAAVAGAARALIGRVHVYFVVDTLEYLHRGGRIGGAARLFGSALNLKPVLQIKEGIVSPLTRVRTKRKALDRVVALVGETVAGKEPVRMAVLHVAVPEEAARLADRLIRQFQPVEMIQAECGPVIGVHAGPGTVGVAFYVE
jgi:DegV family protein with EDD domain